MAGYADALRPEKLSGEHFKRWRVKVTLWLTAMNVLWANNGKIEGELSDQIRRRSWMSILCP